VDPVTAAIAIAALSSVGKLLGGFGAYSQGKSIERQKQADAVRQNQQGAIEANVALDEADRVAGQAAVDAAGNGAGLSGSSQDVLGDLERRGKFNARSALWAGQTKAENSLFEGRVARRQGAMKLLTSTVDAGTTLASAFAPKGS
jgi:hypothetical protein